MVVRSSATYFSTTLISEPATGFTKHSDMGGFGWDETQGLFVPISRELEHFSAPEGTPRIINTVKPV